MEYRDEFNIINKAQNERLRQQDMDDHNHALRGSQNGRTPRFLSPEARDEIDGERKDKKIATALELAMLNAEYAAMYNMVLDGNTELMNNMTDLDDRIGRLMSRIDEKIEETLDKAITLPDGRKVFMHENGRVYSSDDEPVDPALVAGIDWTGRPTYNDYWALLNDRHRLQELRDENNRNSVRAGEIRNDLEDHDNPPSSEQLQSHQEEQEALSDRTGEINGAVLEIEDRHNNGMNLTAADQTQTVSSVLKIESLTY